MQKSLILCLILLPTLIEAGTKTFSVKLTGTENSCTHVGFVTVTDSKYGLLITPKLHHLPSGTHGFHIHAIGDCSKNGTAAGPHYDPDNTKKHLGPYDKGHKGDLPVLVVGPDGKATRVLLAPRLKAGELEGRAIMIHKGGDNYNDEPHKLGGGGKRIACGVIEEHPSTDSKCP